MKTILITGSNGFLASYIIQNLIKEYNIIGLDKSTSDDFRIKEIREKFKRYFIDKIDISEIFRKHKIDIIIHTSTEYGENGDFVNVIDSNLRFPLRLLQLGIDNETKAFINTDTFYTTEYAALKYYSLSKKQFLNWIENLSIYIKVINLKMCVLIGPKDHRNKFTIRLIKEMLNNKPKIELTQGYQKRNFIYVTDAANIYMTIVKNLELIKQNYSCFDIGIGESISIRDYVNIVHRLTESESVLNFGALEYRHNEIMNPDIDLHPILNLGWKPSISIEEALLKTIEYEKQINNNISKYS